jgi:hypothetical protein
LFVERLWRSIKYEEVYLHAYASVSDAKAGVGRYLEFYNGRRPHTALGDRTPDEAYFTQQTLTIAARERFGIPAGAQSADSRHRREFTYATRKSVSTN